MAVKKFHRFVNYVECYDYLVRKVRSEVFFATRKVVNFIDKMICQSNETASTSTNPFEEEIEETQQEDAEQSIEEINKVLDAAAKPTLAETIDTTVSHVKSAAKVLKEVAVEKATVLGQELKERMTNFSLDAFNSLKNVSVQDFMDMLAQIKPMNLTLILSNYVTAQSTSEKFAVLMCLFELVGDFWTTEILTFKNAILYALISILDFILKKCWSSTRDLFGWNMEYMQAQSIEIDDDGLLSKALKFVGIDQGSLKMTEEHSFLVTIVIVLFMIVTGGALTSLTECSVSKIIKRLNKVSSSVKSVHNLQEYLPQVWDNCLDSLGSLLGFNHVTKDKEVLDFTQELIDLKNEVLEYQKVIKHEPWKMLQDSTRIKQIEDAFKRVDEMYIRLMKFKKRNMSSTKHLFDEIRDVVKNLRDYVLKVKNANVAKQEPFLFILGGKPGIGKSQCLQEIAKRVAEKCGIENSSYTRNSAVKHWDNYVGQTWIFYDDFGALKTDLDHGDIMSIKNPAKTIVPMADLQDKGTQISSVGVFAAANETETLSSQVVKSSEALDRRFEIRITAVDPYWDTFKNKYHCSPGDYEKREGKTAMQELEDGTEIPYYDEVNYSHLQFFLAPSYLCKEDPVVEIDLNRAVELCCNLYNSYLKKFQTSITLPVVNRFETTERHVMEQIDGIFTVTKKQVEEHENGEVVPVEEKPLEEELVNDGASTSTASTTPSQRKRMTADEAFQHVREDRINRMVETNKYQETEKCFLKGKLDPKQYIETGVTWDIEYMSSDYKKKFVNAMMNEHGMSRRQAELAYQQKHMNVQSKPEQPFDNLNKPKNKIILFIGDPGTGKSVTQAMLAKHFQKQVIHGSELTERALSPGLVFLEDVSVSEASFRAFEQYVCKVYDGQSHITGICASLNPNICNRWFVNAEEHNRFWRRCEVFEYTWAIKKKNIFSKDDKYTPYDLETLKVPHASCVLIRGSAFTGRMDVTQVLNRCQTELAQCKNEVVPIAINVPYIGTSEVNPQFIVQFDKTMDEAFSGYYDDPMKMVSDIARGKVKLLKGGLAEGLSIAKQFNFTDGNEKIRWPGSLDEFIVMVNNSGCRSDRVFSTQINASDCKIYITPLINDPKKIVMFRLADDVKLENDQSVITGSEGEVVMNEATQRVYKDTLVCKPMAEKLVTKTEALSDLLATNINVKDILESIPFFKNVSGIMIFVMNLVVAGASMTALLSAAKARYQNLPKPMIQEAKGKQRLASKTRNFHVSQQLYNDIKTSVVRNNPSAKDAKVKDLVDYYLDYWEKQDCTGYDTSEYELRPDEIGLFYKDAKFHSETREEKVVVNKPQLVTVMTPYNLECCPYKKIVNYPQLESDTPEYDHTRGKKTLKTKYKNRKIEMTSESLFDPELRDTVNFLKKNDVEIVGKSGEMVCHGLMIQGRVGATVGHCFSKEDEKECSLRVKVYNEAFPTIYPIQVLRKYTGLDVVVFKIDSRKCNAFKTIRGHLQKKRTTTLLDIVENRKAVLNICDHRDNSNAILPLKLQGQKVVTTDFGNFDGFNYVNPVTTLTGIKTISPINTKSGDCGSVIIANDPTVREKVLGIHNAGADFVAHGSFLFQDMFDEEFFAESRVVKAHLNPHHELDLIEDSRESLLGMPVVAEGNLQVHHPDSTQLWTSPLAYTDRQNFQPSILSAYDSRNPNHEDPFYASVGKWNNPQPAIDEALLDTCIKDVGFWYAQKIQNKQYHTKVLTKTEAINSGKNYNVMPINRKSAAGYPWSKYGKKENFLVNKGTGNEAYYGIDLTKKCGQKLNASIDYLINIARKDGEHVKVPFAGCLKDEPVKMSKIETVNTRSFAGAPFDYTIAYRMYFATIYGAIHELRNEMPIQVGINPTSMEWHFMTQRLLSCSDSGFDLDFKGFDAKVPAIIQQKLVEIHNTIAQETDPNWKVEDDIIRRGLHEALVKPLIVIPIDNKTYVVQAPGGQPSGHPGTADDNSLIHLVYLLYAYKKVMIARGKEELATLMHFEDKVQAIIYGDDGVYMVHPSIQEYFNFETVEIVMRELGNECTPAAKNGKIQKIIKITECEFLKRDFVKKGIYWYGALKERSIEKMLGYCLGPSHQWYRDRRPYFGRPEDLKATADACLTEAAIHGREFFDKQRQHLKQCFQKCNIEYFAYRYEDVVARLNLPLPL